MKSAGVRGGQRISTVRRNRPAAEVVVGEFVDARAPLHGAAVAAAVAQQGGAPEGHDPLQMRLPAVVGDMGGEHRADERVLARVGVEAVDDGAVHGGVEALFDGLGMAGHEAVSRIT